MNDWLFAYNDFKPEKQGLREALCTLGNGYFATRGAFAEAQADDIHYPGTYLAGGYNRLVTEIAGKHIENEDLVNIPNWLPLHFRIQTGPWFDLRQVDILSFRQELDLKRGLLAREIRFKDHEQRITKVTYRRFVHMQNRHLAAQSIEIHSENWAGILEISAALDGRVINTGVERYHDLNSTHLEPLETHYDEDTLHLMTRTTQSHITIAQSARVRVTKNGKTAVFTASTEEKQAYIARHFAIGMEKGDSFELHKVVSLYTSKDHAISECGLEAEDEVRRAGSFEELLDSHIMAWKFLWQRFEINIELKNPSPDDHQNTILKLYTFHLLQTTSVHSKDLDVGVPSRGWHGEAYRGHVFWDELFIFPLLNFRMPEITRALLLYRYRRLGQARIAAREQGCRGAMYPWQSGSNGREESQRIHLNPRSGRWIPDNSRLQRHVNVAIAYNIWQYYKVTDDMEFLSSYGAEMFLEIALFLSSIAEYNKKTKRYEIKGVMGPDEYHEKYPDSDSQGLNNNAYTNVMTVWVLGRALEILEFLDEEREKQLQEQFAITAGDRKTWEDITEKMYVPFHDNGIISQFERYDELEEFDWQGYRKKYEDIQRLDRILEAEGKSPNRYKVSKQADVLMLFYLFSSEELKSLFEKMGYVFTHDTIPRNIAYYLQRTSHGSTLSSVVHSWVLARSDRERSWRLFNQALQSDVADIQGGTTPEGIHLGAMAGTVDLVQRCYTDINVRGDILWFSPLLPAQVRQVDLVMHYRAHTLSIRLMRKKMTVTASKSSAGPIKIGYKDKIYTLQAGQTKEIKMWCKQGKSIFPLS